MKEVMFILTLGALHFVAKPTITDYITAISTLFLSAVAVIGLIQVASAVFAKRATQVDKTLEWAKFFAVDVVESCDKWHVELKKDNHLRKLLDNRTDIPVSDWRKIGGKIQWPFYLGPASVDFDDDSFVEEASHEFKVTYRKITEHKAYRLLNKLETFALVLMQGKTRRIISFMVGPFRFSVAKELYDEKTKQFKGYSNDVILEDILYPPVANTFVSIVNELYDVICFARFDSPFNYSGIIQLFRRWDGRVAKDLYNHYFDIWERNEWHRRFRGYYVVPRLISGKETYLLILIQAKDQSGSGIPGWEIDIMFSQETEVCTSVGSCRFAARDKPDQLEVGVEYKEISNSSGTVILRYDNESMVDNDSVNGDCLNLFAYSRDGKIRKPMGMIPLLPIPDKSVFFPVLADDGD